MENLGQEFKVDNIVTPTSSSGTVNTNASMWRSMKGTHKALVVVSGQIPNAQTVTVTLKQATDAAGTDPQDFAVTKTLVLTGATVTSPVGTTGLSRIGYIEFDQQEVYARGPGTHLFVGCTCVNGGGTSLVSAVLIRGSQRYVKGLSTYPTSGGQADTSIL